MDSADGMVCTRDAYATARMLITYAGFVKALAALLAVVSVLGGAGIFSGMGRDGTLPGIYTIVAGLLSALLLFLAGIFIAGQGQLILATVDSAVNSSPFLTDSEKARVMSVPPPARGFATRP